MIIQVSKYLSLCIVICFITFCYQINNVYGNTYGKEQIEEFIQLTSNIRAEKAIEMFEEKHSTIVYLPEDLPFKPTHRYGKVTNQGDLTLHFMRMFNKPHQDIIIIILAPDRKIETFLSPVDNVLTLTDHSKAYIKTIDNYFNLLLFQKNGYGYIIGGNTNHIPKFNAEGLIEIADSIK
ncbi:hypothetical protein ACFFHM_13750 [Halalkalibacter kiskunsagensis]|uniref:DUF4367 domain-containing protein n=1 Tax=Halalkalibacter kiskunsagensis TaxID=1548599 RepID=A0ABV6KEZ2_9BACI